MVLGQRLMYFDAIIRTSNSRVVFNGTPEQVKAFLLQNRGIHKDVEVCMGSTLRYVSVRDYLKR